MGHPMTVTMDTLSNVGKPPGSGDIPPPSIPTGITLAMLGQYRTNFHADQSTRLACNTITQLGHDDALINRERFSRINHIYSDVVSHESRTSDQKSSGRCWMFAGLNVMRQAMRKKYNLPDFEFSQCHLFFFDKLEKANFFLHSIIETIDEPLDGRLVSHLLSKPTEDGGQWDMFANLVNKYGVVPQSVFPESHLSSASRGLNNFLSGKLRDYAHDLRTLKESGAALPCLEAFREKCLEEVYGMLVKMLGEPPETFDWQYRDRSGKVHCEKGLTPKSFAVDMVPYKVEDKISLIHDPREDHPVNQLYTVEFLGNVKEGYPVRYISLPIEELKRYTMASIENDEPVWFGCDVGRSLSRKAGFMDPDLLDYDPVYGTHVELTKSERLKYQESCVTHAMVLTGFDKTNADQTDARKWRIENSWGKRYGDEGYLGLSESGFDADVFEVVVDKALLDPEHLAVLDQDPIALKPWDPIGSLA